MNYKLQQFLLNRAKDSSENWYTTLLKEDPTGVFSSRDPHIIESYKKSNQDFQLILCTVFSDDNVIFQQNLERWIDTMIKNREFLNTPLHFILRELQRTQDLFLDLIQEFIRQEFRNDVPKESLMWTRAIIDAINLVTLKFVEADHKNSLGKLDIQRDVITELSSPVIQLSRDTGLLPIVGDIDTHRAQHLIENTLEQCTKKNIDRLFIDLSGVFVIDTMVAHQIFKLVDSLKLLGIDPILSGLRPEIAQTAVQLGVSFDNIKITSTLAQALNF
ncbi:STAS domain-containing protein [Bacillus sp. NEB1478]|uniref:STAS domain-containing protein n=1 Tax=Bacillus sp. NEB1478 TaxID=3073816 RepID=UPI002872CBC1|nr:STAS domain-containing protein [Bacillus sp. NEB1478]WNB90900.1 STAS domain-containing protein [Bacillus sp. NEB1478]